MRYLLLAAGIASFACSGEDDDGPQFDLPQILPDNSPICLSFQPTTVSSTVTHVALFRNDGRQQLVISDAAIEEDLRGAFELVGIEPKTVSTSEFAHAQLRYHPTEPGWDFAVLRVFSNAQNFPRIRVPILALARPMNAQPDWDPGPKPVEAGTGADEPCVAE